LVLGVDPLITSVTQSAVLDPTPTKGVVSERGGFNVFMTDVPGDSMNEGPHFWFSDFVNDLIIFCCPVTGLIQN